MLWFRINNSRSWDTPLLQAPAQAQQTGSVTGRVLDQTGRSLPGVTIDLVTGATELTAVTDDAGAYRFERVPAGPRS